MGMFCGQMEASSVAAVYWSIIRSSDRDKQKHSHSINDDFRLLQTFFHISKAVRALPELVQASASRKLTRRVVVTGISQLRPSSPPDLI